MNTAVTIALLADPHLSDMSATPQEAALDWAVEELTRIRPNACVWLGDVTACGSVDAALRFAEKLRRLPCPSMVVPGNSDLRTPATAATLERCLSSHPDGLRLGALLLVGMNTACGRLTAHERARLARMGEEGDILLFGHQDPASLDTDSRAFLRDWAEARREVGQRVLLWAHGHIHLSRQGELAGIPTQSVRALDPDKCMGGSPQILLLTWDGQSLTMDERICTSGVPASWTPTERRELADWLGITCYRIPEDTAFAIEHGVRHLEWRCVPDEYCPLLAEWRRSGGQTFSVHLPSMDYDTAVTGVESFRSAVLDAVRAQADMVTVHPLCVLNERMLVVGDAFEPLADAMADALRPLAEAGIPILVENNHTGFGTGSDPLRRRYGCAPVELTTWRDAMEERLGRNTCALRLDIGHARNNAPLSQEYPLGKWYSLVGHAVRGYHVHQTLMDARGRMHNHHPITGLHDGLVALDGFLWAWRTGMLCHAPLILEIREGEGATATWQRLKRLLEESEALC